MVVILGPTASGKTSLACHLAKGNSGEVISADSRQVYRDMDIGTGKDLEEYVIDGISIPYHLIDIKPAGYKYNVAEFQLDFITAFEAIRSRGHVPILCGGSGLYIETALRGNSFLGIPSNDEIQETWKKAPDEELERAYTDILPQVAERLHSETRSRKIRALEISAYLHEHPDWKPIEVPEIRPLIIGVDISRESRRKKISLRLKERLTNGMIEEVEALLAKGISAADLEYYGLEYKWIVQYLEKKVDYKTMHARLEVAIHQFAKRQMTWFRRMERNGYPIHWIDSSLPMSEKLESIRKLFL